MKSADTDNDSTADVFYEFDALGRRVARDDGTQDTIFVQVGQQTIADYVSGTAAASPETTYAWGSYIDELILRTEPSGTDLYYHRNQQYSTYAVTNSSGSIQERYAYSPYGELTITDAAGVTHSTSSHDTRYTYTGREWDEELWLYHFRARMHDATAGRFCSKDPIGYQDGPSLYSNYFDMSRADPSGLGCNICTKVSKYAGKVLDADGNLVGCLFEFVMDVGNPRHGVATGGLAKCEGCDAVSDCLALQKELGIQLRDMTVQKVVPPVRRGWLLKKSCPTVDELDFPESCQAIVGMNCSTDIEVSFRDCLDSCKDLANAERRICSVLPQPQKRWCRAATRQTHLNLLLLAR
jgi:RHS repeat-associated protein